MSIERTIVRTDPRIALVETGGIRGVDIFIDKQANNMMYLVPDDFHFGGYSHVLPKTIQMRRELSLLKVSELPTVVVFPGVPLNSVILGKAGIFGDIQINKLGLNKMDQLYIRTRQPDFRAVGQRQKIGYSRHSLIVHRTENVCFEYVDEGAGGVRKYRKPLDWQKGLPPNTFLMIHAENDALQKDCLHGIVGWTGPGEFSLAVGDRRVHARGLDERLSRVEGTVKPYLRMKGVDPYRLHINGGNTSIDSYSTDSDAERLYRSWLKVRNDVVAFHERISDKYGTNSMTEWRSYPNKSVQVLDVDTGF